MSGVIRLSKIKYFLAVAILFIFLTNRFATKISLFGMYLLDVFLLLGLLILGRKISLVIFRNYWHLLYLALGLSWVVFELLFDGFTALHARRFALSFYVLVPALLYVLREELCFIVEKHFLGLPIFSFVMVLLDAPNISPTLTAEVLGFFVVFGLTGLAIGKPGFYWGQVVFVFLLFAIVASGLLSGQSLYRTPVFAFSIASVLLILVEVVYSYRYARNVRLNRIIVFSLVAIVLSFVLMGFGVGVSFVQQILLGVAGILGLDWLMDFSYQLLDFEVSSRGDPAGNASTRMVFWSSIVEHSFQNFRVTLIGEGHEFNFYTLLFPGGGFSDPELLEPHNSFLSIVFRYGYLGLFFFFAGMLKYLGGASGVMAYRFSFFAFALAFASFEVALESPHGAVIFWVIVILGWNLSRFSGERFSRRVR